MLNTETPDPNLEKKIFERGGGGEVFGLVLVIFSYRRQPCRVLVYCKNSTFLDFRCLLALYLELTFKKKNQKYSSKSLTLGFLSTKIVASIQFKIRKYAKIDSVYLGGHKSHPNQFKIKVIKKKALIISITFYFLCSQGRRGTLVCSLHQFLITFYYSLA